MRPRCHPGTIASLFAKSSSASSARGARAEPRGRAARHAEGGQGQSAGGSTRRQRRRCCSTPIARSPRRCEERAITPAAEWLIDNYHLVERQIREIRADLPPGYYRQLPKLADGPFAGYPRVFGMAWAFVAHTDSRFDPEMLRRYVRAYQEVQPLTIGELWAVAITLRIVLVENLRRLAERIVHSRAAREEADKLADRLLGAGGYAAEPVPAVLAGYERARLAGCVRGPARAQAARSGSAGDAGPGVAR